MEQEIDILIQYGEADINKKLHLFLQFPDLRRGFQEIERKELAAQLGQCVQNQIDLLPQILRTVIVLFDIMEFSHQEIAHILGITIENVKVRLHRARKKLKTILKEKCTFEKDERNVLVCNPIDCDPKSANVVSSSPPSPQRLPAGRQGERGRVRGLKMLEENSQI